MEKRFVLPYTSPDLAQNLVSDQLWTPLLSKSARKFVGCMRKFASEFIPECKALALMTTLHQ